MGPTEHDRPDDPSAPGREPSSVREEASPVGQRTKGTVEDAIGDMADSDRLENKGEREEQTGRESDDRNDIF